MKAAGIRPRASGSPNINIGGNPISSAREDDGEIMPDRDLVDAAPTVVCDPPAGARKGKKTTLQVLRRGKQPPAGVSSSSLEKPRELPAPWLVVPHPHTDQCFQPIYTGQDSWPGGWMDRPVFLKLVSALHETKDPYSSAKHSRYTRSYFGNLFIDVWRA